MFSIQQPFTGQKPDEKVILFIRKHWISFLGFMGLTLGMIIVLAAFLMILAFLLPDFFVTFRSPLILISSAYLLFVLAFFLVGWIDYYFDVVIVTDQRIIDIHQKGLFSREIDELDILHVEDVSARTKGILPTIFRYGDVYVQTAGAARNFLFKSVPYPQRTSRRIMVLYDEILSKQPGRIQIIDHAEGLGPRHFHPSGEKVKQEFEQEVKQKESSVAANNEPSSSQETKLTPYQEQIEKDKQEINGELSEGEEVNFDNKDEE